MGRNGVKSTIPHSARPSSKFGSTRARRIRSYGSHCSTNERRQVFISTRSLNPSPSSDLTEGFKKGEGSISLTRESVFRFEVEVVNRFDEADRARLRAHHDAVRLRPAREKAHPAQVVAGRDAGRGEHHILARHFFERELAPQVEYSRLHAPLAFLLLPRPEPHLHPPP